MRKKNRIHLQVSESEGDDEIVAYLTLPDHPGSAINIAKKTVRLRDLLGEYTGPDLFLDFDGDGALIGLEILE